MAVLSDADRQTVWRALMRYWSTQAEEITVTKAQLQTTVNETDAWINTNQSAYVSSLTHGGSFSGAALTLIFAATALMRKTPGVELLRRALGVDTE